MIDELILKCIDVIWVQFDEDNTGLLYKNEVKAALLLILCIISGGKEEKLETMFYDELPDEEFENVYQLIDKNSKGTIN